MRKRWVIIPIIILVLFTRCSHTVRPQSLIYLDSFDTYTMRAYNYAYNGDKRGKLLGQINYLVADSFLMVLSCCKSHFLNSTIPSLKFILGL